MAGRRREFEQVFHKDSVFLRHAPASSPGVRKISQDIINVIRQQANGLDDFPTLEDAFKDLLRVGTDQTHRRNRHHEPSESNYWSPGERSVQSAT